MTGPLDEESPVRTLARALQHPVRIRILDHLREHEAASPSELATVWGDVRINVLAYHCRRSSPRRYLTRRWKRSAVTIGVDVGRSAVRTAGVICSARLSRLASAA